MMQLRSLIKPLNKLHPLVWWMFVVVILSFLIYFPSLDSSLTSDDYVLGNEIRNGTSIWAFFLHPTQSVFYRPVEDVILYICGMHILTIRLLSISLHCCVAFLVMLSAKIIYESCAFVKTNINFASGAAGCLFAVLPRQNETVVWLASINNLVVAIAFYIAVIVVLVYRRNPKLRYILFLIMIMIVGFASKENIVVFPAIAFIIIFHHHYTNRGGVSLLSVLKKSMLFPPVFITSIIVCCYLVFRYFILHRFGGYGLDHYIGESILYSYARVITNFPRYLLLEGSVPIPLLEGLICNYMFYIELSIIIIISLLIFIIEGTRALKPLDNRNKQKYLEIILLFVCLSCVTILPSIMFSPSLITNSLGRNLYLSSPWFAICIISILYTLVTPKYRVPTVIFLIGVYSIFSWNSAFGFKLAGNVADNIINDYITFCQLHPNVQPYVLTTVASVSGYPTLYSEGLQEAILYKEINVPVPNCPLVGIDEYLPSDSIITFCKLDSGIQITDNKHLSEVGIWPDTLVLKQIDKIWFNARNSLVVLPINYLSVIQRHAVLVIHSNHLIQLDDNLLN